MTQIAVLGLGIMGLGMARNLVASGHEVTVWNRTPRTLHEDLTGATVAATIAEAVAGQERVLTCLTGPQAQRDVLLGEDGALVSMAADSILADATTTDPHMTAEVAAAATAAGVAYLDTPVFGSRNEAWEGRLDWVCGGPAKAFEAFKPLLEDMAATVHYMGESGAGTHMKLIGNLLVAAQMVSLGEALALARKVDLSHDAVMGVLDVTDFSSGLIRGVGRATLKGDFSPSFYLKHMLKDARLIGAFATDQGVPLPMSGQVPQLYQAALNEGLGNLNASGLHKLLFRLAGLGTS